ncbi:MAG TPA: four helix bundle protein [Sphingobacterium sp.]|nr:four helix bundle protein [Sphingobacterium sp.]
MKDTDNLIVRLSFEFSMGIIEYCELLESERKYVLANQLLKSGTSIGANIREAQNAESKADFIHKFKIAAKEIDETQYWLELCLYAKSYPDPVGLPERLMNIANIANKIIITSKMSNR